jgi:surface polysaccharide O-acyltransferase-like enzyme
MDKYLSDKFKGISFLLIILVVFLHANNLNTGNLDHKGYSFFIQNFLSDGIARIAVPLFFGISGYLFFFKLQGTASEFLTKYKKRFSTLFIPYLFWSLWGLLLFYTLQNLPQSRAFFNHELINDYTLPKFLRTIFLNPLPYQLWFIRDLMVLVLISPGIFYLVKYLKNIILALLFVCWLYGVRFVIVSNESILFFTIGAYINRYYSQILNVHFSRKYLYLTMIWILLVTCTTVLSQVEMRNTLLFFAINKAGVLFGILAAWSLYDMAFLKKDFQSITFHPLLPFTFFIYASHEPILTIVKKGLLSLTGKQEFITLAVYFVTIFITITISLIAGYLVRLIIPRFYSLVTGGR